MKRVSKISPLVAENFPIAAKCFFFVDLFSAHGHLDSAHSSHIYIISFTGSQIHTHTQQLMPRGSDLVRPCSDVASTRRVFTNHRCEPTKKCATHFVVVPHDLWALRRLPNSMRPQFLCKYKPLPPNIHNTLTSVCLELKRVHVIARTFLLVLRIARVCVRIKS